MSQSANYTCDECGAHVDRSDQEQAPECCGQPMTRHTPLPVCEITETAEHSRMDDLGEPCDDGRGNN